ncbi:response regulator transcription factor [Herbaspirillum sp. HC18]|nr:response regulator transcription factor [Herbaspirillum sp. HC18]
MKVFLVEDSELILEHLRDMLAEVAGVQTVGEASTEDNAIRGIEASRPDLVILDLTLAQGSGIEVLRRTKRTLPAAKTVVLTNRVAPQYRQRCLEMGADCFLDKTRDFTQLRTLVERFRTQAA